MRKALLATGLGAMAAVAAGSAGANDELNRMSQNPAEWAMPTGDYANTRYSKLKQINADETVLCGALPANVRMPPLLFIPCKARAAF